MRMIGSICVKHPELNGERRSNKSLKGNYTPGSCVGCNAERELTSVIKNMRKLWRKENKKRQAASDKKSREKHFSRYIKKLYEWRKNNPAIISSYNGKRRAARLSAAPAWANKFFISEAYDLAKRRTALRSGGHKWHVDHIVPLQSKLVCGLHVENNIRVIPSFTNSSKGNRYWPDMPERCEV